MRASWRMNKTDRELLEAAAKAAGLHFHGLRVGLDYTNCYVSKTGDAEDWFVWSPLTDDGDALRLAVTLSFKVNLCLTQHAAQVGGVGTYVEIAFDGDPYAATRRAIVRAAAAIVENK